MGEPTSTLHGESRSRTTSPRTELSSAAQAALGVVTADIPGESLEVVESWLLSRGDVLDILGEGKVRSSLLSPCEEECWAGSVLACTLQMLGFVRAFSSVPIIDGALTRRSTADSCYRHKQNRCRRMAAKQDQISNFVVV